ncbi:probable serine/threonine-protein kinase At1g01540 isoform X1 [Papaver somniferum]|nr:probable serine/threonine-protein kinase At1g01540 isoform X1 [Papaver somniferum]
MASLIDTVYIELSKPTIIFGIKLWILITICIGLFIFLILCCIITCCCRKSSKKHKVGSYSKNPNLEKIVTVPSNQSLVPPNQSLVPDQVQIDVNKTEHRLSVTSNRHASNRHSSARSYRINRSTSDIELDSIAPLEISPMAWVRWFTLRELNDATDIFSNDNVIGEGQYGIVYRGVLPDGTWLAVKWLFNSRGQAENEFKAEVEALGHIRHKNLVTLLGYCLEGSSRMLVYEYVDNGNLNQWLHKDVMQVSPLTWDMRLDILIGIAKGLSYLHEGLEHKIVHRDVKSCNILLDQYWNPKVADFGLSRVLDTDMTHVTTRVIGTYGYVAPEYACAGILNDRSDVYSFGVLVMEMVSGRSPSSFSESPEEMSLVDWLKKLIETQRYNDIVDPKLPDIPSSKSLKSVLLLALRCVDPDAQQRPKMGQIVHMLESTDRLHNHEFLQKHKITREASHSRH